MLIIFEKTIDLKKQVSAYFIIDNLNYKFAVSGLQNNEFIHQYDFK